MDAMRERGDYFSPQDYQATYLGSLAHSGDITRAEYEAGERWRTAYLGYLQTIGCPTPFGNGPGSLESYSDELCEKLKRQYLEGVDILKSCGRRVLHAVNAIAVFGEPDELGDPEYTLRAAKIGLSALAAGGRR
jgi:hypothetical protein